MNEVTRPNRPWGTMLSAVATVSALALFHDLRLRRRRLRANLSASGTTSLTLKKGFKNKLGANDVKLLKVGSGKVAGGPSQLQRDRRRGRLGGRTGQRSSTAAASS